MSAAYYQNCQRKNYREHRQQIFYGYVHLQNFFYLFFRREIFSKFINDVEPLQKRYGNDYQRHNEG